MAAADITLLFVCTGLVFLMTPGLAFFYGGLVRKKNVLSMMAKNMMVIALVTIIWFLGAYSLAFAPGTGFIGGIDYIGYNNVWFLPNMSYSGELPHLLFSMFQLMTAIITVAIVASPFAERVKFGSFLVFAGVWLVLVYAPIAHWVWGVDGWLKTMAPSGILDFAGGTVVHVSVGFSALAVALVIGPRKGYRKEPMEPASMPYVVLGMGLLWFGWFGFNGGSALAANDIAVLAMFNTNLAACAAGFTWVVIGRIKTGKSSLLGFMTGALAGLVAITPAAGYVPMWAALVIGLVVGGLCYATVLIRGRSKIDESLDAWAVHGCGGLWGTIATGIFAAGIVPGAVGLIAGNAIQLWVQSIGAIVTMVYSFVVTYIIAWIIKKVRGLRVKDEEESLGLDITQHGEKLETGMC
jgi:Amt family ammonium transporter